MDNKMVLSAVYICSLTKLKIYWKRNSVRRHIKKQKKDMSSRKILNITSKNKNL